MTPVRNGVCGECRERIGEWGRFRGGSYCRHCGTWWGLDPTDARDRLLADDPVMRRYRLTIDPPRSVDMSEYRATNTNEPVTQTNVRSNAD